MTLNDYLVGIHWHDVIVVGAGHNGLVAALLLARKGLKVLVLEERDVLGGAARTERPFSNAPDLPASTGAGLFGLMPPELLAEIGLDFPLVRRDPHTFLPTPEGETSHVVFGSDAERTKREIARGFSDADARAYEAMQTELGQLCDDVARTWLEPPVSIEETAERCVRPALRNAFVTLCRGSAGQYVERWGFRSDRLRALLRLNAGLGAAEDPWTSAGSGMRLLVGSMGRLPGSGGAWMAVRGGVGSVSRMIADEAVRLGVAIQLEAKVGEIVVEGNVSKGVVLKDGTMHHATAILCNADPFRMRELLAKEARLPPEYEARIDGYARDGGALKLCLAMSAPPDFACWPGGAYHAEDFAATAYLLPGEGHAMRALDAAYDAVAHGRLPDAPAVLFDLEPRTDTLPLGESGLRSASLFVGPVPFLDAARWGEAEAAYVERVFAICDRFSPGFQSLVVDTFVLPPPRIAAHFGLTRGQTQHVDNAFGFADRLPYATPVKGLYSCSAGTHPAGGVVGAAGHNAAALVLSDLGRGSRRPTV
jgi:phytoene dehydrogenase-like protein